MYLLVEKRRGNPAFPPVVLSADNPHDAYEDAAERFSPNAYLESSVLYEMGHYGEMKVLGRFYRGVETVLEGEVVGV